MNISINAVKDFNQSNIATLPNDRVEEVEKIISENPEFNKITNVLIAYSNNQYFIGEIRRTILWRKEFGVWL